MNGPHALLGQRAQQQCVCALLGKEMAGVFAGAFLSKCFAFVSTISCLRPSPRSNLCVRLNAGPPKTFDIITITGPLPSSDMAAVPVEGAADGRDAIGAHHSNRGRAVEHTGHSCDSPSPMTLSAMNAEIEM